MCYVMCYVMLCYVCMYVCNCLVWGTWACHVWMEDGSQRASRAQESQMRKKHQGVLREGQSIWVELQESLVWLSALFVSLFICSIPDHLGGAARVNECLFVCSNPEHLGGAARVFKVVGGPKWVNECLFVCSNPELLGGAARVFKVVGGEGLNECLIFVCLNPLLSFFARGTHAAMTWLGGFSWRMMVRRGCR